MFTEAIKGFLCLCLVFVPLERVFYLHKQKILRSGWTTDAIYYFTGNLIGKLGLAICLTIAVDYLGNFINPNLQKLVANQPIITQFIAAIFIAELCYYTAHRLLHTVPVLWQFHAVHHSVKQLDWLAAVRVHPCDQIFTKICQIVPLYCLGFSEKTFVIYFLFSAAIAFFIHSNIRLRFPLLRWLIVTPEFHHWHHSTNPQAYHTNYTAQLPLVDFIFGTFYLPLGKFPQSYGITAPVPRNYWEQILYPFPRVIKMIKQKLPNKYQKISLLRPIPIALLTAILTAIAFLLPPILTQMSLKTWIMSLSTQTVTVNQLKQQKLERIIFIDVRTPEEYAEDHIDDSILIPLIDIEAGFGINKIKNIANHIQQSEQNYPTIVLYCTSGYRSLKAYKALEASGLNSVVLAGGIKAWRKMIPTTHN
ncbi:MAG: hypothetical protein F6K10_25420 [Moorea sp. SIO2B7]|nr:hypothetical protein [Moorena sp. SIO2B7]